MQKTAFDNYIKDISSKYSRTETSEMGYRTDFEILLNNVFEEIKGKSILHDSRANQGNKPDFIVLTHDVPILYIEAKDIGISLDKVEKSEQMARYFGYANLVLTDYTEFRFFRNGLSYCEPIKIAQYDAKNRTIIPIPENYELAAKTLVDFTQSQKEPIKSGNHLAKIMGGRAQRIRDNVKHFLSQESEKNQEITRVYDAIKKMLVHDLTLEAFADMYAQTLVYGLFVARYYDESPDTFTRQEARDLVPGSNPFLQHFFDHIAGPNFDKRLSYIVDELCLIFQHANTKALIEEYMGDADPVIHFYEDFLKEYDPELRKKMGAYYTPLPVVRFIVRAVDDILQKDFNLPGGLADTSKLPTGQHKVQILDPAVGTGTFISATIRAIYEKLLKQGQEGRWPAYVHNDLLPRLHGFELMMAPYTIAHLKLSLAFKQTGFWKFHRRLGIYLTNSLEQSSNQQDLMSFGFAESIAAEAKEADKIKNETPIMVVIGNPPYSGHSSNNTEYANNLVKKYKFEPGGKNKLKERNAKWLNDDYVKFIALAENMVTKNGEGILAMITNNGYLDNPTFRGMRWQLAKTFNKIYVLDLHGNTKKQESSPNGDKDENVFDIQQGVSIVIAVKIASKNDDLGEIYHSELYGKRAQKFEILNNSIIDWQKVIIDEQFYTYMPNKNPELKIKYNKYPSIQNIFKLNTLGFQTHRDYFAIGENKHEIQTRLNELISSETDNYIIQKYNLKSNQDWSLSKARERARQQSDSEHNQLLQQCAYRPFDNKYTYLDEVFSDRPRTIFKKNLSNKENLVLGIGRQGLAVGNIEWCLVTVSKFAMDANIFRRGGVNAFPLYLYNEDGSKTPNLNLEIVNEIEKITGKITPEDIFNYIYAILHSPNYREKYKEFLKNDFPRIPYPKDAESFKKLEALGAELRSLHLLESSKVNQFITTYPISGSDIVEKISYKDEKVFINPEQYFGNVPEAVWNFYIGGYQPAQKWLKDRKEKVLSNEDIEHYQKIIKSLSETDQIKKKIDLIIR